MNNITLYLYQSDKTIDRALSRALRDRALTLYFKQAPFSYADCAEGEKPRLCAPSTTFFNVSHSAGVFLLAVGETDVGVDVEHPVSPARGRRLAARFFTEAEQERLNALEERAFSEEFTRLWCEKEARGKLSGAGVLDVIRSGRDACLYTDISAELNRFCEKNAPLGCLCTEKECTLTWVRLED